jgi:hypothetical protein
MSMTAYYTLVSVTHTSVRTNERRAQSPELRRAEFEKCAEKERDRHTPVGRKGIRFLFRNPAAEPHTIRALVRVFVGVTQNDLETPSGDPGRVFFSV